MVIHARRKHVSNRPPPPRPGGQRKHDLRIGRQPAYVDKDRTPLNRVLIKPETAIEMRKRAENRRARQPRKRAMKSNTAVSFSGIITFGHLAQDLFEKLTPDQQDAAFRELAEKIVVKLDVSLTGLVVHMDEDAVHAHFQMDSYDSKGAALSDKVKHYTLKEIQDLTAGVMSAHCPGIERGNSKRSRLQAGAKPSDVINKSPAQLRRQITRDIDTTRQKQAKLDEDVAKLTARIEKLQAHGDELTEKGKKQLATAQRRLEAKEAKLAESEARLAKIEGKASLAEKRATEAVSKAEAAEGREKAALVRLEPIRAAMEALDAHNADQQAKRTTQSDRQAVSELMAVRENFTTTAARLCAALAVADPEFRDAAALTGDYGSDRETLAANPRRLDAVQTHVHEREDWEAFQRGCTHLNEHVKHDQDGHLIVTTRMAIEFAGEHAKQVAKWLTAAIRAVGEYLTRPKSVPLPEAAKPFSNLSQEGQQAVRDAFPPDHPEPRM